MKQKEKKTPMDNPAWLVVFAKLAIMAVSRHTESMHPISPATTREILDVSRNSEVPEDVLRRGFRPTLSRRRAPPKFDSVATVT